jgi:type IV secretory pathway VirB2 component (pilin)
MALILLLALPVVPTTHAVAQPPTAQTEVPASPPATGAPANTIQPTNTQTLPSISAAELSARFATQWLAIIIAAVIIGAFCLMYAFGAAVNDFSRHYIVIVVVVASIFLLVMGYSEQQVAPAFGLLGTILGYMFGRASALADKTTTDVLAPPPDQPGAPPP